jgi:transposase
MHSESPNLYQRSEETTDAETPTRYRMIVLAQQGHRVPQIAPMVPRSEDPVARVLKRLVAGGLDAIARGTSPNRQWSVTAAWQAELVRVIALDPHEVGQVLAPCSYAAC